MDSVSLKSKYEPSRSKLALANCGRRLISLAGSLSRPREPPNGPATEYFRWATVKTELRKDGQARSGLPGSTLEERFSNTMLPEPI